MKYDSPLGKENTEVWITQKQEKKEETLTEKNEHISGQKAHTHKHTET